MKEVDPLVGRVVETMDGRIIRIIGQRNIGGVNVYRDKEGNVYTDYCLNIRHVLTPGRVLFLELVAKGIVNEENWDSELYEDIVKRFFINMDRTRNGEKRKGGEQ